ncbi:MAG: hypothetical protein J6B54_07170 [Clostridia bacterium]|nr:hypothetical protein [Clostridia bacterium]
MKFNLEETVTGADLRNNASLLVFAREKLREILLLLETQNVAPDAFVVDRERVTMAVFFPDGTPPSETWSTHQVLAEDGYFRLTLQGHRLTEGKGLAALWDSVLADENIPLRLSCSDCGGVVQYLPDAARDTVLQLLNRTFGIRGV